MELFRCEKLNKKLGDFQLKDISFSLEPGMILGLIGVNGSGKTSLIRSILGSYRICEENEGSGEMWLEGKHFRNDMKEYRKRIAFILQDSPFIATSKALQIGEVYGAYYDDFDLKKYRALLKEYDINERAVISNLSKGEQLKLQLAFMESRPASLYIFDEPAGNLDVEFRDHFYEKVRKLVEDEKSSVIISSHLVTELETFADELLWLKKDENEATVRYNGTLDDLKNSYRLIPADKSVVEQLPAKMIVGGKTGSAHNEFLLYRSEQDFEKVLEPSIYEQCRYCDLQEIMYYVEKKEEEK